MGRPPRRGADALRPARVPRADARQRGQVGALHAAPRLRGGLAARVAGIVLGLFLFAGGIVAILESKLGLSPWDVLNQGVSRHSPLSFGTANICISLAVLVLARALGATLGFGTWANAVLIGTFIDLLLRVGAISNLADSALPARIGLLAGGILTIGLGTAFYIGGAMGAGPRDSLMLVIARRTGARVGLARAGLELCALAAGFALGGTVGVGTLAFALGIGPSVELWFWIFERSPLATRAGAAVASMEA